MNSTKLPIKLPLIIFKARLIFLEVMDLNNGKINLNSKSYLLYCGNLVFWDRLELICSSSSRFVPTQLSSFIATE